jgi:excisionase family DNA binding protein
VTSGVTEDSRVGSGLHEAFNSLTLLGLSETVGVRPTRLLSPFPEAFGPTLVQEMPRRATAVQFLTVREVAARLRVSSATVYRLCAEAKLRHVRVSNALRITEAGLEGYLRTSTPE